jgi:hypothetical protein
VALRADLRLCVAERFHVRAAWNERLALSSGVARAAAGFVPAEPWRPLEPSELDLLLAPTQRAAEAADDTRAEVQLLVLPRHLREAFWHEVEQTTAADAAGVASSSDALSGFAMALVDFLRFKELPLPERALCAVVAAREDSPTTRREPRSGAPRGLEFDREGNEGGRLRLATNLGDESTYLTLLGLTAPALRAASDATAPVGQAGTARPAGLAAAPARDLDAASLRDLRLAFFAAEPSYPVLRVRLEPGEGVLLPALDLVMDGWTLGQTEPQILAVVRESSTG